MNGPLDSLMYQNQRFIQIISVQLMNTKIGGGTSKDIVFRVESSLAKKVCKEGNVCK